MPLKIPAVTAEDVWEYTVRKLTNLPDARAELIDALETPANFMADVSGLAPAGEYDTEMGRITAARATLIDTLGTPWAFESQPIADVDENPPTKDLFYTNLDEAGGLLIALIVIRHVNDEASAKNIDMVMTIDGVDYDATPTSQASGEWRHWPIGPGVERLIGYTNTYLPYHWSPLFCHAAKIEIAMTSDPGTNEKLDGRVHWAKLVRVSE